MLQLPEPVVSKLLSMDAGDLDLMVQHPVALQAQVYELLDVLQVRGVAEVLPWAVRVVLCNRCQQRLLLGAHVHALGCPFTNVLLAAPS